MGSEREVNLAKSQKGREKLKSDRKIRASPSLGMLFRNPKLKKRQLLNRL